MGAPTPSEDCLGFAGILAQRVERGLLSRAEAERALHERAEGGCSYCRRTFEESLVLFYGPQPGRPRIELGPSYSAPEDAEETAVAPVRKSRRRPKTLEQRAEAAQVALTTLLPQGWARRRERVTLEWFRFRTSAVAALFLEESLAALPGRPGEASQWADLALLALSGKRPQGYPDPGERVLLRLRTRLLQGNAARLRGDHAEASALLELTVSLAEEHQAQDLAFWAEAKIFVAALRRDQRNFTEAARESLASAALYRAAGRADWEVKSRWQLTAIYEQQGDYAAALEAVREAIPPALTLGQPVIEFGVRHSEVTVLARLGRFTEAAERYDALTPLARLLPDRAYFRAWTRGFIEAGLGHPSEAETSFRAAREGFLAEKNAYDAALVTLDWALVLLDQNRADEVLPLAVSMGQAFEALGVARETLASWAIFQAAAERRELTHAVAESLVRTLGEERVGAKPKA